MACSMSDRPVPGLAMLLWTVLVVAVIFTTYDLVLVRDPDPTPVSALVELHLATLAVASAAGFVLIAAGAHRNLAASLVVGATAGAATGLCLSLVTGTGFGADLNGLVFRVIGAAVIGFVTGLVACVIYRRGVDTAASG
jgi:hypothetical protein